MSFFLASSFLSLFHHVFISSALYVLFLYLFIWLFLYMVIYLVLSLSRLFLSSVSSFCMYLFMGWFIWVSSFFLYLFRSFAVFLYFFS